MAKLRNITVTLDEELARWVRVWSAQHDSSVSRMIANMLRQTKEQESQYAKAMDSYFSRPKQVISKRRSYPKREDLYD